MTLRTRTMLIPTLVLALFAAACGPAEPAEAPSGETAMAATPALAPAVPPADTTPMAEATVVVVVPTASGATDPNLFPEGKYTPVADIKAAADAGADIVFVDSRTQSDFQFGHIPGAVNVPYFEAAQHVSELPKDRWIVTYCECPHAEAEQVADALIADGFTMVRVMDEGLQGWRDAGGEIATGPPPSQG